MFSNIGSIVASTFNAPLTKTLIGSAAAITNGNFSAEIIAEQIVAVAKASPNIDMNTENVRKVVDLVCDEVLRMGGHTAVDVPVAERQNDQPLVPQADGPAIQIAPQNAGPPIPPVEPARADPQPASPPPVDRGAGPGGILLSPAFKLVFLSLFALTILAGLGATVLTLYGHPAEPSQQEVVKTFESAFTAGITALIAFLGGKAL